MVATVTEVKKTHHGLNIGMRHGIELRELQLVIGTNVDVSALVLRHVAVLGRREDGDALSVVLLLVTVHANLVTADDGLQTVLVAETLGNVGTKLHANTALAGAATRERLRICPEHLHHETSLTGLLLLVTVELADVVERDIVVREETAVEDEELLANQRGEREGRETFRKELVGSGKVRYVSWCVLENSGCHIMGAKSSTRLPLVVLVLALALEAVHPVHVVCLVVSAVDEEAVWP